MGNLTRPDGYLRESRRPLTSLVFVLPLLAVYEGGVLVLGMSGVRNGADVWLRQLLELLGFGGYFLLPVLTIGALLAWHHVTQEPWRVRPTVLYGMFVESVLLGLVLLLVAHQQARWFAATTSGPAAPCLAGIFGGVFDWLGRLVAFFGAGIY